MSGYTDKLKRCLNNIIKSQGYVKYSIDEKKFTREVAHFLGVLLEVNIKEETNEVEKESNLFLKIITPDQNMTVISLPECYKKELFLYKELSQMFSQIQDEVKIPYEERYRFVKIYKESTEEVIILDNMRMKGYETTLSMDISSIRFAELAVKELAKFHALSFALKARRPDYFEKNIKTLEQPKQINQDWINYVQRMCNITLNCLDGDRRRKFEDFIPTFAEKYKNFVNSKCGRDTLCHGDYKSSNILFKKVNEEITELIPIDYQLIYHGCPVVDFIYFIFLGTDRNFRKNHLTYLKDLYYKKLGNFLEYFNLDVANIYPKEEFETHYSERLVYGLTISIIMLPIHLVNESDNCDITKGDFAKININVSVTYEHRIVDIIDDFIEWGYL